MDWSTLKTRFISVCLKYKYVVLIFLVGCVLMLIPSGSQTEKRDTIDPQEVNQQSMEERLVRILSGVEGVGRVQVLLTESRGEEIRYQTDEDLGSDGSIRRDTVIITNEERKEQGLVKTRYPPAYMGAVVVCQGADRASVRLAVTEAVSKAAGIPTDRITVLKMK